MTSSPRQAIDDVIDDFVTFSLEFRFVLNRYLNLTHFDDVTILSLLVSDVINYDS